MSYDADNFAVGEETLALLRLRCDLLATQILQMKKEGKDLRQIGIAWLRMHRVLLDHGELLYAPDPRTGLPRVSGGER